MNGAARRALQAQRQWSALPGVLARRGLAHHTSSLHTYAGGHPSGEPFEMVESEGVLRVRLASNAQNLLTSDLVRDMDHELGDALARQSVRALHLESAVPFVFSMGLDPSHVCELPSLSDRVLLFERLLTLFRNIYAAPVPTSVLVSGGAYAGGAVLAIACDKRVFLPAGVISFSEVKVGLPVPRCIQNVVRDAVTSQHALMELCTLGSVQDAHIAHRSGIATDVAEDEEHASKLLSGYYERCEKLSRRVLEHALFEYKKENIAELDRSIENLKLGEESEISEFLTDDFLLEGLSSLARQTPPEWKK